MVKNARLLLGDCKQRLAELPDNSIGSVVTDPPYGLTSGPMSKRGFMGLTWDGAIPDSSYWSECLRVLKPGGYLLAFGSTRTYHHLALAVEQAGFTVKDTLMWVTGSGFPKSRDISKDFVTRQPASKLTKKYHGYGTALKPAIELIVLAQKPFKGSVADNLVKYGVGALNINACRVPTTEDQRRSSRGGENGLLGTKTFKIRERKAHEQPRQPGRFPANLIHDGSDEVLAHFPETKSGALTPDQQIKGGYRGRKNTYGTAKRGGVNSFEANSGSAARFFYAAKVSPKERTLNGTVDNNHPTVKPIALLTYLVKLVTPPDQICLDPFMGSGSTGLACLSLGRKFIGIEREVHYFRIAKKRLSKYLHEPEAIRSIHKAGCNTPRRGSNANTLFDQ